MTAQVLALESIFFDLDGTLIDTIPDLHAAACAMLCDFGKPQPTLADTKSYVGRGVFNLVKRLLAASPDVADDIPAPEDALMCFRDHYRRENGRHARCYPGVAEGLKALNDQGFRMAVITNKPIAFARPLLEQMGLDAYFEVVLGGDSLPKIKPDPMPLIWACGRLNCLPQHSLFVGDSGNDLGAARAAGCPVFLLPYGYSENQDVHTLGADAVIESISEICPRVCRR